MWRTHSRKLLATTAAAGTAAVYLYDQQQRKPYSLLTRNVAYADAQQPEKRANFWQAPSRAEMLDRLKQKDQVYDLLVVGGGATGAGTAVDAATRGLNVAIVERDDFAAGKEMKKKKSGDKTKKSNHKRTGPGR